MLFNSIHYYIFAPFVIVIYYMLPHRAQRWWILLISLYFYAIFRVPFLAVFLGCVTLTFLLSIGIDTAKKQFVKKIFLFLAIAGNISLLYSLKYIDFSIHAFDQIMGLSQCDPMFVKTLGVVLPLGISFFTLQAISYAVDVYRGDVPATRSIFDMTLFLSFFPHLVAGPIVRAKVLIHQFAEKHPFKWENFHSGMALVAWGLFKKTLVADQTAVVVDSVFASPEKYGWLSLWLGVFFHTLQIYCDFSGYSDVAIGTARIMGYKIPINFMRPILSESMTDLWRRWHISLSTWLRDYLYIPLGGSRVSVPRSYLNVLLVMAFGGFWHGADWTYIFWGLSAGAFMLVERFFFGFEKIKKAYDSIWRPVRVFYAMFAFGVGTFFFRAHPTGNFKEGLDVALYMLAGSFTFKSGDFVVIPATVLICGAALILAEILLERDESFFDSILKKPVWLYTIIGSVLLVCFFIYSVTVSPQFIYFQF